MTAVLLGSALALPLLLALGELMPLGERGRRGWVRTVVSLEMVLCLVGVAWALAVPGQSWLLEMPGLANGRIVVLRASATTWAWILGVAVAGAAPRFAGDPVPSRRKGMASGILWFSLLLQLMSGDLLTWSAGVFLMGAGVWPLLAGEAPRRWRLIAGLVMQTASALLLGGLAIALAVRTQVPGTEWVGRMLGSLGFDPTHWDTGLHEGERAAYFFPFLAGLWMRLPLFPFSRMFASLLKTAGPTLAPLLGTAIVTSSLWGLSQVWMPAFHPELAMAGRWLMPVLLASMAWLGWRMPARDGAGRVAAWCGVAASTGLTAIVVFNEDTLLGLSLLVVHLGAGMVLVSQPLMSRVPQSGTLRWTRLLLGAGVPGSAGFAALWLIGVGLFREALGSLPADSLLTWRNLSLGAGVAMWTAWFLAARGLLLAGGGGGMSKPPPLGFVRMGLPIGLTVCLGLCPRILLEPMGTQIQARVLEVQENMMYVRNFETWKHLLPTLKEMMDRGLVQDPSGRPVQLPTGEPEVGSPEKAPR